VIPGVGQRLDHLIDDELFGWVGGITHAEVDHVDAVLSLFVLKLVDLAEEVRRQTLDAVGHRDLERLVGKRRFGFTSHSGRERKVRRGNGTSQGRARLRRHWRVNGFYQSVD